jgi:hypothetical protein
MVSALAPAQYAVAVEQTLEAELQRARYYLHRDTEQEVLRCGILVC